MHPDRIWTKAGAWPGDVLVLSKPIGTGIVLAGGGDEDKRVAIARMRALNADAANVLQRLDEPPHAVTDVTGFGLFGHAWEMAERSGCRLELDSQAIPLYPGALGGGRGRCPHRGRRAQPLAPGGADHLDCRCRLRRALLRPTDVRRAVGCSRRR